MEPIGYCQLDESVCSVETQISVSCGCFGEVDANLYIGTEHGSLLKVEIPGDSLANSVSDNYRTETFVERIKLSVESNYSTFSPDSSMFVDLAEEDQSNEETSFPVLSICSLRRDDKQTLLLSFGKELASKVSISVTLSLTSLNHAPGVLPFLTRFNNGKSGDT